MRQQYRSEWEGLYRQHKEDLHPQVVIVNDKSGEVVASYSVPVGAHLSVKEGQKVDGGIILARTPRKASKTKDITGGLPRIAELFEARRPKDACVIAKLDGVVSFGGTVRGKKKVVVTHEESGETADHLVPMGHAISIADGDYLKRGEQITDGPISPDDLLPGIIIKPTHNRICLTRKCGLSSDFERKSSISRLFV